MVEQRSGSSTPQRSCSAAGLHRPRSSFDSVTAESHSLSGSLTGSLTGSTLSSVPPRLGSHTMDFFEMCASLITTLARWWCFFSFCLSVIALWKSDRFLKLLFYLWISYTLEYWWRVVSISRGHSMPLKLLKTKNSDILFTYRCLYFCFAYDKFIEAVSLIGEHWWRVLLL